MWIYLVSNPFLKGIKSETGNQTSTPISTCIRIEYEKLFSTIYVSIEHFILGLVVYLLDSYSTFHLEAQNSIYSISFTPFPSLQEPLWNRASVAEGGNNVFFRDQV